ncbi:hypothetical protein ACFLW5_02455 [Chloroflexota bacterium]
MAAKKIYFNILRRFVGFTMTRRDYHLQINYNLAVGEYLQTLSNRYGRPKSTMAHLTSALGFQLLNEIEQEEGICLLKMY